VKGGERTYRTFSIDSFNKLCVDCVLLLCHWSFLPLSCLCLCPSSGLRLLLSLFLAHRQFSSTVRGVRGSWKLRLLVLLLAPLPPERLPPLRGNQIFSIVSWTLVEVAPKSLPWYDHVPARPPSRPRPPRSRPRHFGEASYGCEVEVWKDVED
jgi:hypothetical protein